MDYVVESLGINPYLIDDEIDRNGNFIAPNKKTYLIKYNEKLGYYSNDMYSIKYFPTLTAIKDFIKINNPATPPF
ncbi:MAG: hypothetical protein GXP45_07200 [bacterium]|nr:hypothetical protein [bacterium]